MPRITVKPHDMLCPQGMTFEAKEGEVLTRALLDAGIAIPHACEMMGACATCHVYVRKGFDSLSPMTEAEEDKLELAWGVDDSSRLSCKVKIGKEDLVIELPRYNRNRI